MAEVLKHLGNNFAEKASDLIASYSRGQQQSRLVRHHIESYNHFIQVQAANTLKMFEHTIARSEHDYIAEHGIYSLEIDFSMTNLTMYPPQV